MNSNKKQVLESLEVVHSGRQPALDERSLAHQVTNLARVRLIEAVLVTMGWVALRKTILPRFGFITTNPVIGGFANVAPGLGYLKFKESADLQQYLRLLGMQDKESDDLEYKLKRQEYVNQFWTNSQYWH